MSEQRSSSRLWVVSELYAPDDAATAHLLTQIAEHAADSQSVCVLCAQPTYTQRGKKAPTQENLNGVEVTRCWSTTFSKDNLVLRVVNMVTIVASFFLNMLFRFRSGDVVLVVTNPPPLPFATQVASWLRGARTCLLIHDIYPDVLVPTGITTKNSLPYRIIDFFNCWLFRRVHRIIAIGRDMKQRVVAKSADFEPKIEVIPNWYDESFQPVPREENQLLRELPFREKFIVQYSGNIGRTHGLSIIAEAAEILQAKGITEVHWMVCGWGGGKPAFEEQCKSLALANLSIHEPFPRDRIADLIGVASVSLISFIPGMSGISVPSRMYNILAAGCPIIGVTDSDSELALTINDDQLGWVSPPNCGQSLAKLVESIYDDQSSLPEIRRRCRSTALSKFNREQSLDAYVQIVGSV